MTHLKIIVGVLILTVTVLLNTRPAEAVNCATVADCKNDGTCPNPNTAICTCAHDYKGDLCGDECVGDGDCGTGGTCGGSPMVCSCQDTAKKGPVCTGDCRVDGDCSNGGTCKLDVYPHTCDCGSFKGLTCADECTGDGECGTGGKCETGPPRTCTCADATKKGPGCTTAKSGASAVTGFSLMSLLVVLTGYLL